MPRNRRKRSGGAVAWIFIIVLTALLAGALWMLYQFTMEEKPSTERVELSFGDNPKPIFAGGEMLELPAVGTGEELALPFRYIKEYLDPYVYYEEGTHSFIITTADKVVRFKTDQLTAWMNEQPFELSFPVQVVDGEVYVPVEALHSYYDFDVREHADTGAVLLHVGGEMIRWASVQPQVDKQGMEQPVVMRTEPSLFAPIGADLAVGDRLMIWSDESLWYGVQMENGWKGYVHKQDAALEPVELVHYTEPETAKPPWKPLGGKVNLTWEHVERRNPDTSAFGPMPGLNVVSPTWFALADDDGKLANKASAAYVDWAHGRGYQVWALFSNDFDPDRTSVILDDFEKRMYVIKQLVSFAKTYRLQGINIDFENVYERDKDKLTQFVRELTPYLHEQGLVVSIDVTIRGGSPMWSLFLDREALGKTVDYMAVMTYDEHWASSPVAGSVASLPWVEKGITDIMQYDHVPASKLLLGVPYYTRIWTEQTVDGKKKVSSRAVGMRIINELLAEKNLTPVYDENTGQDYVEYTEDGKKMRIWIENERSMRARMDIVNKYDLGGVASWRRGFETPIIWEAIKETLEKRPQ